MLSAAQTPPEFGMSDTGLSAYSIATLSSNKNSFQLDHNGQFTSFGRYMQAKVSKLMQQVHNDVQRKSALFKGLSFYINGYTNPTSLELRHLIISNGGEYHHYYFSDATTYIVACNLSASKWKTLRANEKVIRPEWIIECVKRNRILPDDVFRLRPPNFIGASLKLISTTTTKTAAQINRLSEQRFALGDRLISTNLCQNSSVQPNITHFFRVRKTPSPNIFSDDGKSTKAAVKSISSPLVLKSHSFEFDAQKTNSTLVKSKYATRKSSRNKLSSIHKDTYRKDASDETEREKNFPNVNVQIKQRQFFIGNVQIAYTKAPFQDVVQQLLQIFIQLVLDYHFHRAKCLFEFFRRNILTSSNVHKSWPPVIGKLRVELNNVSRRKFFADIID